MLSLKINNGDRISKTEDLLAEQANFYSDVLYSSTNLSEEDINSYLQNTDVHATLPEE